MLWSVEGNFVLKVRFIGQQLWYLVVIKGAAEPAAMERPHIAGKQKKNTDQAVRRHEKTRREG
ncbi:MAG: hypothetical protein K2P48_08060 [Lachnospiraceae bacterium]|nr:hypothetical protein [Lachnospiraceae bacterium]